MEQPRNTPPVAAPNSAIPLVGRRLTARSVILSSLLGTQPARARTLLLVRTCGLFGISEGTARVAISRMVSSGELVADGRYLILGERLIRRQARQTASRAATHTEWDGRTWLMAVVTAGSRSAADRAELRTIFTHQHLAQLREGTWLRPDNLATEPFATDTCTWFRVTPETDPTALAASLWDLTEWAADAGDLLGRMGELQPALDAHDHTVLASGFELSASVIRHLTADPLLPEPLLPDDWPGDRLRRHFDRFDESYRALLHGWFRTASESAASG